MFPVSARNANLHVTPRIVIQPDDAGLSPPDLEVNILALSNVDGRTSEVLVPVELLAGSGEDPG